MKKLFVMLISFCLIFTMTACGSDAIQSPLKSSSKTACTYLFMVKQDGRYGFVNEYGEVIIPIKYRECKIFNDGVAAGKCDSGDFWEIFDTNGNVIGETEYYISGIFSEGLAAVSNLDPKNPERGFVNTKGELVIPFKPYDMVGRFEEGFASVRKPQQMHAGNFINMKGEEISPVTYDLVTYFYEGMAEVRDDNDMFGFIDTNGDLVIPTIYDSASGFSHGLAAVSRGGKSGYINKNGDVVIDFIYNKTSPFSEDLAIVNKDGVYMAIDTNGNEVLTFPDYKYVSSFSEGLARVEKGSKIGFVDKTGELVIPVMYNPMGMPDFKCGVAVIEQDGKYGVIDKENNVVVPFEFDYICTFEEGYAVVEMGGKYGVINTKGEVTVDIIYDELCSKHLEIDIR